MTIDVPISAHTQPVSFEPCEAAASPSCPLIELEGRVIHIWGFTLDTSGPCVETFHQWLDRQEKARASRFVHKDDGRRYILAHGTLRAVLSRYLGCLPATLTFERRAGGKPFLVPHESAPPAPTFNMAHSQSRVLIAVARRQEIGIDLEQTRVSVDVLKLAQRFYTAADYARLAGLPAGEQAFQFFRYWTAKEAILKGQGLGLPSLGECGLAPSADGYRSGISVPAGSVIQPDWTIQWLSLERDWAGAVACRGKNWSLRNMSML